MGRKLSHLSGHDLDSAWAVWRGFPEQQPCLSIRGPRAVMKLSNRHSLCIADFRIARISGSNFCCADYGRSDGVGKREPIDCPVGRTVCRSFVEFERRAFSESNAEPTDSSRLHLRRRPLRKLRRNHVGGTPSTSVGCATADPYGLSNDPAYIRLLHKISS